jgi:hypothetical protein
MHIIADKKYYLEFRYFFGLDTKKKFRLLSHLNNRKE